MSPEQQLQPSSVAAVLEYLAGSPRHDRPLEGLLQRVADLTKTVMPGHSEASVVLLVRELPSTVVATGRLAADLDQGQFERGDGPCLHAAGSREIAEIADTRSETRWPDHVRHAAAHGNLSSLSVPLVIGDPQVAGALNIYARQPSAFDPASRSAATRIAPCVAVAVESLHLHRRAVKRADKLEAALASRAVIEQAKGILIERHKVTADEAFHVLARASIHTHVKVRRLAEHLVHTGELSRW